MISASPPPHPTCARWLPPHVPAGYLPQGLKLEEGDKEKKRDDQYKEMFKPLLDYVKELLGKKVEKVQISKHLVNSPVVVLSADYGWTAQMEKVMKSQASAHGDACRRR